MEIPFTKSFAKRLPQKAVSFVADDLYKQVGPPGYTCSDLKEDTGGMIQLALAILAKPGLVFLKQVFPQRLSEVTLSLTPLGKIVSLGPVALDVTSATLVVPLTDGMGITILDLEVTTDYMDLALKLASVGVFSTKCRIPPILATLFHHLNPGKPLLAYSCDDVKGTGYPLVSADMESVNILLSKFM